MMLNWLIRLCRHLAANALYLVIRFGMPVHACLVGYKRSSVGICTILAPPKQMRAILEGITFLQTLDPKMFQRLTAERRYIFWYHSEQFLQCREIFSITNNFLAWGKEGVAICFVQSILDFTLKYLPSEKTLMGSREAVVATRSEIQQQLFNWISEHSFPGELVKQYQEFAEKQGAV